MIKLPYSIADFKKLRENNYYYVDKTNYIEVIENTNWPILLRPRRFGKSLFTSMLFYYYDINSYNPNKKENEKDLFDTLFEGTYIYNNLTPKAHDFYVINFNFSGIEPTSSIDNLRNVFCTRIKSNINSFSEYYQIDLNLNEGETSPSEYLHSFFSQMQPKLQDKKIYVIIDEYDHFTNDLLTNRDKFLSVAGKKQMSGEETTGFLRAWFEVLKLCTENDIIGQIFVTGVSPVTLDSMTSGYNIGSNISLDNDVNELAGFTKEEVKKLLIKLEISDVDNTLKIMEKYYNGYMFDEDLEGQRVFNPNMVFHYLNQRIKNKSNINLLDKNITSDYSKFEGIFNLFDNPKRKEELFANIVKGNSVSADDITPLFNLALNFEENMFLTMLYYFGLLTLKNNKEPGEFGYVLKVPNQVINDVYSGYYFKYLENQYSIDVSDVKVAIYDMIKDNKLSKIIKLVELVLTEQAVEDYKSFDEYDIKAIMFSYLRLSGKLYNLVSEQRLNNQKRADLVILPNNKDQLNYYFLIELKYVSTSNKGKVKTKKQIDDEVMSSRLDAINQINIYCKSNIFNNVNNLKKYVIVFVKSECVVCEEII